MILLQGELIDLEEIVTSEGTDMAMNEEDTSGCADITGFLLGWKGKTDAEMYELYRSHACALGFTVRKSSTRYSVHGKDRLLGRIYICSCAGFKKSAKSDSGNLSEATSCSSSNEQEKKIGRVIRTGCKALLKVKLNDEGLYEVTHHFIRHNHPLTEKKWSQIHGSERETTEVKADNCSPWGREMAHKYYKLVLRCQENEETRKIVEDGYNRDLAAVNGFETSSVVPTEQCEPSGAVTRGKRQKMKGHFQRKK